MTPEDDAAAGMYERRFVTALLVVGLLVAGCGSGHQATGHTTTGHTPTGQTTPGKHQRSKLAGLIAVNRCLRSQHIAIWPAPNIYLHSKQPPPNILVWEVPHTRQSQHTLDGTGIRVSDPPRGYAIVAQLRSAGSAHAQAQAWLRYDRKHHYGEAVKLRHNKVVRVIDKPQAAHIVGSAGTVAWVALDTQWPQTKVVAACVATAAG